MLIQDMSSKKDSLNQIIESEQKTCAPPSNPNMPPETDMLSQIMEPEPDICPPTSNLQLHLGGDTLNQTMETGPEICLPTSDPKLPSETDEKIQSVQAARYPDKPRVNPSLSEIVPGVFIGDHWSSYRVPGLRQNHIKSILSAIEYSTAMWYRESFTRFITTDRHLKILCRDSSDQDLLFHMQRACDFIEASLAHGAVLVHCEQGVSRSTTFVIAYLMRRERRGLDEILAEVKQKRKVRPSENFTKQLRLWGEMEYNVWDDEESKAPKEPYAKLVKEKGLTTVLPKSKAEIAFERSRSCLVGVSGVGGHDGMGQKAPCGM